MPAIKFDDTYEPRPWGCDECGHLLGVVMRTIMPGAHKVRRLWIFADPRVNCLPATAVMQYPPRGLFRVHGIDQAHGVECSNCGALNGWSMNKESYLRLLSYYGKAE